MQLQALHLDILRSLQIRSTVNLFSHFSSIKVMNSETGSASKTANDLQRKSTPEKGVGTRDSTFSTVTSSSSDHDTSTSTQPDGFPVLHFSHKRKYVVFYVFFLFVCNFIVPVILFYPLVFCKSFLFIVLCWWYG